MDDNILLQKEIRQHINYGTNHLEKATLSKLQEIRQKALAKQDLSDKPSWGVSLFAHNPALVRMSRLNVLLPMILFIAIIGGSVAYWHHTQRVQELSVDSIEAHLLGEDLPVGAYLDKDFNQWLGKTKNTTTR